MTTQEVVADQAIQVLQQRVLRADNGSETPIAHLQGLGKQAVMWSIDERMRLVRCPLQMGISAARGAACELTLASGRRMQIALTQRLRALNGWIPAGDLSVGHRVAALRRVGEPLQPNCMAEPEIIMLAHMIGDGSCVKRQPVRYASIDDANLEAVTAAAAHFGIKAIRDEYAVARVTTLRLPAPYRLTHGKRNPIAAWLDGLGLFGLRSCEKFVPSAVFETPDDQISLFLRHLWATDGSVRWDAKTAQGRVYYASTSRRLIDDVSQLLLRVGVQGRITRISKQGYRECWHLTIDRATNQLEFLTKVGVHGERAIKAAEVVEQLGGRVRRPGTDTVPIEIWDHVKTLMAERRWSDKDFALATNTRFDGPLMWTHAPGRDRLRRIANVFEDQTLHDLATNDIYWDRVVEVSPVGLRHFLEFDNKVRHPLVMHGVAVLLG